MRENVVETLIGAFVLIIAGGFLYFALGSADIGSRNGYDLTASFDRADGLTLGTDVRLSGIKIGTVTQQALNPKTYQAQVLLTIQDEIMLPEDSVIKIASESLLGGTYLSIEPGGSDEMLIAGGEFEYTQGAVDLVNLLSQAVFSAGKDAKQ